jgi:hypothetical protein
MGLLGALAERSAALGVVLRVAMFMGPTHAP